MQGTSPVESDTVHPVLRVRDVAAAIRFYTEKLGFTRGFVVGDPPTYAGVNLGRTQLFLDRREPAGGGGAYFRVDDVDGLFELHRANGVTGQAALVDQDYGLRDYAIRDPDGNMLAFGQPHFRDGPPIPIERVDVPLRLETRLAALLHDLAAAKRMSLASCVEEILLHTNDGVTPHTDAQVRQIQRLKAKHGIDYDTHASYRFEER